jgi:hypothetical protein
MGYVLWDPSAKWVVCSCHVHFDEHVFYGNPAPSPLTPLLADDAPAGVC